MFVRNAWYVAAWADELGEKPLGAPHLQRAHRAVPRPGGRAAALEDRCCHRSAPLSLGELVGNGIQCGYHGLVFDGPARCVAIPGQSRIPDDARVRSYPRREGPLVWIWMGDRPGRPGEDRRLSLSQRSGALAQQARRIPDQRQLHADGRQSDGSDASRLSPRQDGGRQSRGACRGRDEDDADDRPASNSRGGCKNSVPPPSYVKAAGFKGRVDRWQEFEFVAPSTSCNGPARPMPAPAPMRASAMAASSSASSTA